LVLASGTENAKINILEVVQILKVETPASDGNTYVVGLESKQEQYIATTSLTKADPDATLAQKAAWIVQQSADTTDWDAV
jgi:hypothetical protein